MTARSSASAARGLLVMLLAAATLAVPATLAGAAQPRTSLPVIERQVMCVTCKIPLNVAQSPQADRERAFIQGLIDQGYGESQVKRALVDQYGSIVLGLPGSNGFDLSVYLVPLAVVVALLAALGLLLPRWRRRTRADERGDPAAPRLDPADAARLDSDLARFD